MELLQWPLLMHLVSLRPSQVTKTAEGREPVIIANNGNNVIELVFVIIIIFICSVSEFAHFKFINHNVYPREADMRSIIGDVVTALEYLVKPVIDEKSSKDVSMKNLSIPEAEEGGFAAEASSEVGILSKAKGMDGWMDVKNCSPETLDSEEILKIVSQLFLIQAQRK
ncbi:hypothetical protein EZV62_026364 [Acer yangbiense]|uniref:Uncharacterized protein n=1 Tax=Acer yangbiense TaxID=1000413 RepID=A0A5C7GRC6_9ROSI|nr:hypothetical protein EZV62_026364 [Acer yangbiense]